MMAPEIVPTPPASDVPPTTAAAITNNSSRSPNALVALFNRADAITAAIPAKPPLSAKILTVIARVLMPDKAAASGLPPMAKTYRPKRVRVINTVMKMATTIKISTG